MTVKHWINKNTSSLRGKTVAVVVATGGIGSNVCMQLALLGADIIFLGRNKCKSDSLKKSITEKYPDTNIRCIRLDLGDMESVKSAVGELAACKVDILILCAGLYAVPRERGGKNKFNQVFGVNFASQYCFVKLMLPCLREHRSKVVAVGSIAHRFCTADENDIDFSRKRCTDAVVYGNAKRYMMFSLIGLLKEEKDISFSLVHPGISFTGITSHYPVALQRLIKLPMKLLFISPSKAALNVIAGIFKGVGNDEWIGPSVFGIWGYPKKQKLRPIDEHEYKFINDTAERIAAGSDIT